MNRKITPPIERKIIGWATVDGLPPSAMVERILAEDGISVTVQAVRKVVARTKADRQAATQAVVKEQLGRSAVSDLDRLDRIRSQIARKARSVDADPDRVREWTALKKLEAEITDRKLHYAGADAPDESTSKPAVTVFLPPETDG